MPKKPVARTRYGGIGQVGLGMTNSGEANLSWKPAHCDEYYEKRCFSYR